jgi:hypothetical protein
VLLLEEVLAVGGETKAGRGERFAPEPSVSAGTGMRLSARGDRGEAPLLLGTVELAVSEPVGDFSSFRVCASRIRLELEGAPLSVALIKGPLALPPALLPALPLKVLDRRRLLAKDPGVPEIPPAPSLDTIAVAPSSR